MKDSHLLTLRTAIPVVLLILIIGYAVSDYSIGQSRTVETLTFGLLSKPLSFQLHDSLAIPFLVFLLLHIFFRPLYRSFSETKK